MLKNASEEFIGFIYLSLPMLMKTVCLTEGVNFGRVEKKTRLHFACASLTSYGAHDVYDNHYHENSYLSLVVAGGYTETNHNGTDLLSTGELIYRPASYNHANNFVGKPGVCFNLEFTKDWQQILGLKLHLPNTYTAYAPGTFVTMHKALYAYKTGNDIHIPELLICWLIEINEPSLRETDLRWIKKVKDILEAEYETNHSLESLASRVHVHPVYMANYFKQKTGCTVGEYQQNIRLKKAMQVLTTTKKSVTEVALEAGYFDAAHFIRNFARVYGVTPSKFRKVLLA